MKIRTLAKNKRSLGSAEGSCYFNGGGQVGLLEKRTSAQSVEKHSKQEEQPMQRPLLECMSLPLSTHIFHVFTQPFTEFKGVRGQCLLGHLFHCTRSSFGQGPHNGQLHSHPTGHPDMSRRAHTQTYTPTLVQRDLYTAAIEKGTVIVQDIN